MASAIREGCVCTSDAVCSVELDEIIREKTRIHETPMDRYKIKLARSAWELEQAFSLLHMVYMDRKLDKNGNNTLRITPQHVLAESLVFVAHENHEPMGTITLTKDSPAKLPLDKDYPEELDDLRRQGARLAEAGSFAISRKWRFTHANILLSMTALWVIRNLFRATHCVIGCNPACENYYRAVYNFYRFGEPKWHAELDAPVVGLFHEAEVFEEFLREKYHTPMQTGCLPYEHFCYELPDCIQISDRVVQGGIAQWKIARQAFREIFIHRSQQLYSLDPATEVYLRSQRGPDTLRPEVGV